ncbi:MAG: ATP-binding cassette domain-containing protein [Bryobacteraceae bacterium]
MRVPLEITSLTKTFHTSEGAYVAVKDFTAKFRDGEFVCLLGHSGCGKSTVLSIIAGLQRATLGGICIDGVETDTPGKNRAFVFQTPSLLPWMSTAENVSLAVTQARPKASAAEVKTLTQRYLDLVGVGEFALQMPPELSQGTQQRVSIARALALEPRFLLLDEPFGMLDSMTRFELQDMVLEVLEKSPKITIMVTHDVEEALYLADRIILMTDGPAATLGAVIDVPFPRPRTRAEISEDPRYFQLREQVLGFLEHHTRQFQAA